MSNTIDFGIDLGTTNSVITKFANGKVEVFKNPIGHKETLPSVVAFRNERIIVGDKAREFMEKDPQNVIGGFKRKMGTDESFFVHSLSETKTPVELSSVILKELKNFVHTGEEVKHAVITIPASFDTVQSNATQKAAELAGFVQPKILQEPIAASLAFLNNNNIDENGNWLVYDLGGGTFDVAIVKTEDGEMDIIDHEGDNYLGGLDFDNKIIEKIICPHLREIGQFEDLLTQLKSAKGKYNKKYYELLKKSEDAKVALSSYPSTEIEFEIEDEVGTVHDVYFTIQKEDFEKAIMPLIDNSIELVQELIERNASAGNINEILLIGGSTYIPILRTKLEQVLGIKINTTADPTTAVAVGAAFYAGTIKKPIVEDSSANEQTDTENTDLNINVKCAYQKTSKQKDEYFAARFEGDYQGLKYRVVREDGGFDSSIKEVSMLVEEDLPLIENSVNTFKMTVYSADGDLLSYSIPPIEITHGAFGITGQPLPEDICIEVDDMEDGGTKLEVLFERNAVLPLKKIINKEITTTIRKGSDDGIYINILEGHQGASPSTNKPIGTIEISGNDIERDLVKGSDVEIVIEINESRELKVSTYLMLSDQDFINVFRASERSVNIKKLNDEIFALMDVVRDQIIDFEDSERYEEAEELKRLEKEVMDLFENVNSLAEDDVTDARYQLEDKKRKLSQKIDGLVKDQKIIKLKMDYAEAKKDTREVVENYGDERDKKLFEETIEGERSFLATNNKAKIRGVTKKLYRIYGDIRWKDPEYVRSLFYSFELYYYHQLRDRDKTQADNFIEKGKQADAEENINQLRSVVNQLYGLLPDKQRNEFIKGTGIN